MALGALRLEGALYDNRAWPLFPKPFFQWQTTPNARGFLAARAMFLGADEGYGTEDESEGLYDFWGKYNEIEIDKAAQKAGLIPTSLFPPQYQGITAIPWTSGGRIALRGCMIEGEFWVIPQFSCGGSLFVGNQTANSAQFLVPDTITPAPGPGDLAVFRNVNVELQRVLNASTQCYRSASLGDINIFARGHIVREYWYKFHHIDFAAAVGLLLPSSQHIPLNNPVAFPVGGDGLTGIYAQFDCEAVLKSEISAGLSLWICQRLPKTASFRMPVDTEPNPYGALQCVRARYTPGITLALFPYVEVCGLREGLGLAGGYYLVRHFTDRWNVLDEPSVAPKLDLLRERSVWGRDMFTVSVLYDFGYGCEAAWYRPLVSLSVDIPWKGPVTERVPKTHAVSVRIESRI